MKARWVPHDIRDELVDFVRGWSDKTELSYERLVGWIGLATRKFRDWRVRYGRANEHNGLVPRDHWLEAWERAGHPSAPQRSLRGGRPVRRA